MLEKILQWHNEDKQQEIVDFIEALPQEERVYEIESAYGRALNNLDREEEALDVLERIRAQGEQDAVWHWRIGYSLYFLDREEEAAEHFQKAIDMGYDNEQIRSFLEQAKAYAENKVESSEPIFPYDPDKIVDGSGAPAFDKECLLKDMYRDDYFPDFLVDKVRILLLSLVSFLENGAHTYAQVQEKLDEVVLAINALQDEFEKNDSEIETAARESIAESVELILKHFAVEIDTEQAIRERDW